VSADEARELGYGRAIRRDGDLHGEIAALCEGRLVALVRATGDGWVRPHLVLRPAEEQAR
jgi:hypothetical protein